MPCLNLRTGLKLQYSGKEDEIIKKIEAGDVTLPLTGTLITGSYSLVRTKDRNAVRED